MAERVKEARKWKLKSKISNCIKASRMLLLVVGQVESEEEEEE
jgi:hypothetical protein